MRFRRTHGKGWKGHEEKKVAIAKSIRLTAWQCFVHLLPISTSMAILAINFHGFYIGVNFPGLANSDTGVLMLLQLAAKAHEIMIIASLSQIIWHVVRHELLYGGGLPLGLLGSGLSFSSFEFYFKKEFLGSLRYLKYGHKKVKRIGFMVLLIVSGITAILAGPASAILLKPGSQDYTAGGTDFYLNGSASDFWPEDLSGDIVELQKLCPGTESALRDICPAGGFFSLWEQWSSVNHLNSSEIGVSPFANSLSGSRFYWPVHSPASRTPPIFTLGNPRSANESVQPYSWLVQAHAASAILLDQVTRDWWKVVPNLLHVRPSQIEDRNIRTSARSAFAAVRCTGAQNVSTAQTVISFPSIEGRWDWGQDLNFEAISANTTSTNSLRFQWVHLPDNFGVVSIGAVIELPWIEGGDSRVVVGCSAQTGWVPTTLRTDAYTFWSGYYPYGIYFGERTPSWVATRTDQTLSPTNGRIALGETWLDLLTPRAPPMPGSDSNASVSTIEIILAAAGASDTSGIIRSISQTEEWAQEDRATNGGKRRLLETIISSILADGLSRSGSYRVFSKAENASDGALSMYQPRHDFDDRILQGRDALELPESGEATYTVLHASMLVSGYAFRSNLPGRLAAIVLVTHAVLASVHVLWLVIRRRVSRSWDSIAELIALAQNSQPPDKVFQNTGAGIGLFRTFATIARIRLRQQDRIELVFEEDLDPRKQISSGDDNNASAELQVIRERPVDALSRYSGTPVSWTFPVDSRKVKTSHQTRSHDHNDSTEDLIPRKHVSVTAEDLVQIDHAYG